MSVTAVFVPGIMGTELKLPDGEVVWPPKVSETVLGYNRIKKLQSPKLIATEVIRNVSCVAFYSPILTLFRQMGYDNSGGRRLLEHPYDWRRDLFDLADDLADALDAAHRRNPGDEIALVAHSMGGLISRLVLETGIYANRAFFPKISKFIALATPHNGAPLALARVLGLDKALGISGSDFRKLSQNEDYPSGYQLLPAPGEDACWDTAPGTDLGVLDIYDPQVATALGMKPALVARAKAVHDAFGAGAPPDHVRYFYFSGAGHKTCTRINVNGDDRHVVFTPDAGDGTVPLWSQLPRALQKQVVINEHANVFRGTPFKRVFARLLGADAGEPLEAVETPGTVSPLHLSLQRPIFEQGNPIELVIASETLITDLEGALVFDRITDAGRPEATSVARQPLRYIGPGVYTLAMTLEVDLEPGYYELSYQGDRPTMDQTVFVVSK